MSYLFGEGASETEPIPSWYSVVCGQGTYDVRAFSHDDAGVRTQQYVKDMHLSEGFPLSTEYEWRSVLNLEIIWQLTGGDRDKPEAFTPIMRQYAEPEPFDRSIICKDPAPNPQPQLFEHAKS